MSTTRPPAAAAQFSGDTLALKAAFVG